MIKTKISFKCTGLVAPIEKKTSSLIAKQSYKKQFLSYIRSKELFCELYTVKKAFRYSRPQLGCHLPYSPWAGIMTSYINYSRRRESLEVKSRLGTFFTVYSETVIPTAWLSKHNTDKIVTIFWGLNWEPEVCGRCGRQLFLPPGPAGRADTRHSTHSLLFIRAESRQAPYLTLSRWFIEL